MKTLKEAFTAKYAKYGKIIDDYASANDLKVVEWSDITKIGLANFVEYLQENAAQSSVKTYCAMLKSVLNLYSDEVALPKDYDKILSVKGCTSQQTWLDESEIEKIISYRPESNVERIVRDRFIIGCISGCRYSDIVKLTKDNIIGECLVYVSEKTHMKAEIPLSNVVLRFLKELEYNTRTICKNTANSTIRNICRKCGITQNIKLFRAGVDCEGEKYNYVAFHTARRSFATNLYLRGLDLYSISKLLGHSEIQMTAKYIVCPPKITDKALEYFKKFE